MSKKMFFLIVLTGLFVNEVESKPASFMNVFVRSVFEGAAASGAGLFLEQRARTDQEYVRAFQECHDKEGFMLQRVYQVFGIATLLNLLDAYLTSREDDETWQDSAKSFGEVVVRGSGISIGALLGYFLAYPDTFLKHYKQYC